MRGRVGWMAMDQTRSGWGGREEIFWSFIVAVWRGLFGGAPIRNDDIGVRCLGCRNDRPVFQPPDTTGAPIIMP